MPTSPMLSRLSVVGGIALLAACGGAAGTTPSARLAEGGLFDAADWGSPLDGLAGIVPADATYAFVADIPEGYGATMDATLAPVFTAELVEQLRQVSGRSITGPADLRALGFDLEGDYAMYSTGVLPVAMLRVANVDAIADLIDDVLDLNPDVLWEPWAGLGPRGWRFDFDQIEVLVGFAGPYLTVSMHAAGHPALGADEAMFLTTVAGGAGRSLADGDLLSSGRAARRETLYSVGAVDLAALFRLSTQLAEVSPQTVSYESDALRSRCAAQIERMGTALPAMSLHAWYKTGERNESWGTVRLDLGTTAAQTAARVVRGAPALADDATAGAAMMMSLGFDLAALLDAMRGDASLVDCPDAAAIAGGFAQLEESARPQRDQAMAWASGWGSLGVFGFRGGFTPAVDAVVGFGTPNPVGVVEQLQSMLTGAGATGSVDATAPFPTFVYSLFGQSIRIAQQEDRVVVGAGSVPVAVINTLATASLGGDSAPFASMSINGPVLYEAMTSAMAMLATFGGDSATTEALNKMLDPYRTIERMTATAAMREGSIVFETYSRIIPP